MIPENPTHRRVYRATYWSVTLPEGWENRMDRERHLFASPRHHATIRVDEGFVGRWGDVEPILGPLMWLRKIPGKPRPVRYGEFRGLYGGHVTDTGRRIDLWSLAAGRLALMAEFQSSSATTTIAVAEEVLSSLAVERAAVNAHPLEKDTWGALGRLLGTAAGMLWYYRYAIVFLILAAVIIIARGTRS